MASVVLTGAAGFIGRHVAATLAERGVHVTGIDRRPWLTLHEEVSLVDDLADPSPGTLAALSRADGIIHLAGRPGVRDPDPNADRHRHHDNVVAGGIVLRSAPLAVPVVVASSSSVYGGCGPKRRASHEGDDVAPRGGYARSKVALERLCHERADRGGRVAVARPFTAAGEGQRPDMAFSRWIAAARTGRALQIFGGPDTRRDITDVRDVAEGLVRMLERDVQTVVNLGSGSSHRIGDLPPLVAEILGMPVEIDRAPAHPAEVTETLADTTRCRELLDLEPTSDVRALLARQANVAALEVVA